MNQTRDNRLQLLRFLSRPESYPGSTPTVERKETHISWIFLTDRSVYKLKKPLNFAFLDFSTLALREKACREEVRLGLRLSPSVYLGAEPITMSTTGKLEIGGYGQPVDWLVRMRRLDESQTLENRIHNDQLSDTQIIDIANLLSDFFTDQPPVLMKADQYVRSLTEHIRANESDLILLSRDDQAIKYLHAAQFRYLFVQRDSFGRRVCDGRIVDGHGDLRPEHIFLESKPAIIDCVEFNEEYRRNDIADELAFLAMECDRLGRPDIGSTIQKLYCERSRDDIAKQMLVFYKAYRACVRLKIAMLRAAQSNHSRIAVQEERQVQYMKLAREYCDLFSPSVMIMIGGKMGSGKSTLARRLADRLQATLLQTDTIRAKLFGTGGKLGFADGMYSEHSRWRVYKKMFESVPACFLSNPTVILDATFSTKQSREEAIKVANASGAKVMHFECECPESVAIARISQRASEGRSSSEAQVEHYQQHSSDYETADISSRRINTETPLLEQIAVVTNWLAEINQKPKCA